MKTTVEIQDGPVAEEHTSRETFKLRDESFHGDGMVCDFTWAEIKAMMDEDAEARYRSQYKDCGLVASSLDADA